MSFRDCFAAALGCEPYPYQVRLACGRSDLAAEGDLRGAACQSQVVSIPTGLGKTAGVVMAWLWNRVLHPDPRHRASWPRRLVYCLPMRTLVEQTRDNIAEWVVRLASAAAPDNSRLVPVVQTLSTPAQQSLQRDADRLARLGTALAHAREDLLWLATRSPIVLMGGEDLDPDRRDWDLHPEKPALLVGTQDMLLSRALNRGYGMSRYRWPLHFALLNNDALWIVDETQLMGVGLETTAQLDAFRQRLGSVGAGCFTWWISATLDEARLLTIDHSRPADGWPRIALTSEDLARPELQRRYNASKPVSRAPLALRRDTARTYTKLLAEFVRREHQPDSLTLVILNRVARARELYQELRKLLPDRPVSLIHSRFRPCDRQSRESLLHEEGDRIVVATQAVEAGVDISARTLIMELAPWPAIVQRLGRCNRRGEFREPQTARVFWVDIDDQTQEFVWPYVARDLQSARQQLEDLEDASPAALDKVQPPEESALVRPVLRKKDILELFDTTPDLAGHDLDVSRFIRDEQDTDVQVFWREVGEDPNQPLQPQPMAHELCRVPWAQFQSFVAQLTRSSEDANGTPKQCVWTWNPLAERWQPVTSVRPGATYLVDAQVGGYSAELGWLGVAGAEQPVPPAVLPAPLPADAYSADETGFARSWVTLADHANHVVAEAQKLAQSLHAELSRVLPQQPLEILRTAARWHDIGKAHPAFQALLRGEDPARSDRLWAKSGRPGGRCARPFFRHELASALAWLQAGPADCPQRDLIAYLVAAHHGKVRLSIRSLPGEEPPPEQPRARIARGIVEGDAIPPEAFGAIGVAPLTAPVELSLEPMEMGRNPRGEPSWLERMLRLRDHFGPFQLAFLESLLRAADARASQKETGS